MNLLEAKQERARLITEERSVLDSIQDKTKVDAATTEKLENLSIAIRSAQIVMQSLERQEEEQRGIADANRQREIQERAATDEKGIQRMVESTFRSYVKGVKPSDLSPEEQALYKEAVKRGQVVGVDANGGFLTPDYFSSEVVKSMKYYGGVEGVASIVRTNDGNSLSYPKRDSTSLKAALVAEVGTPGSTTLTYGRMTLDAYKYSTGIFTVSNELIQDSIVNAEQEIIESSAESFGRAFNEAWTTGNGSSKPLGVIAGFAALGSNAGIGKVGSTTTGITYAEIVDTAYSLDRAYMMNATWMFNHNTEAAFRKIVDSTGQPLWSMGDFRNGSPDTILGRPYVINNDMADFGAGLTPIAFGDFKRAYKIRMVNGVGLKRLNELYATSDEVGFVAFMRMDADIADVKALKLFKGAAS
jgi:HK97 family phage major capsid protein